ncbi:helix-turn-helix transcriptional regulator [Pullulanibacillus sp. KACC 23026]|uniref:helix-turn-helix transcriptional regulator n=1 Tax=Pullulanibacillus sp. KACC 23026 TaxID=3028315 RepID=UPI0023B07004|nr:helix-turn-helix transcriptional regulator [Pullulanibacillus sp. KACC 23026]WEG14243.1 helix-turn-helix transcriptional regulator [Pullulanibacillus sp. KACC 23026]
MELNERQNKILQIVKEQEPITGDKIADQLNVTRATLRPDLAILTMSGFLDARPRVGYFFTGKSSSQLLMEKVIQLTVKDYQSIPVVVQEATSAYDAVCTMFLEDVGTLFVVNKEGYLTGALSRKDLLRASLGNQDLTSIPVSIIMSRMPNLAVCEQTDLIIDIAKRLIDHQIDGLPVVRKKEKGYEVIGRITKTNITRAFTEMVRDHD